MEIAEVKRKMMEDRSEIEEKYARLEEQYIINKSKL